MREKLGACSFCIKRSIRGLVISALLISLLVLQVHVMAAPALSPPIVNDQSLPTPRFVANYTRIDEDAEVFTVVFKLNVPESKVREIYQEAKQMFTAEKRVQAQGNITIKVIESRISGLVQTQGRYLFKVATSPNILNKLITKYAGYIEQTITKPKPLTMERKPKPLTMERPEKQTPLPNNYIIRNIIGASRAQTEYGVTGRGISIAIVDTGVDYGHPDLTTSLVYWTGTYKGIPIREPLALDADESQVLLLQEVSLYNSTHIYVGGKYYTTLQPWPVDIYPPYDYYRIPTWLVDKVQSYKFGVTYMFVPKYGIVIVGVLMIKYKGVDYYSTLFVDANGNGRFDDEVSPSSDSYARGSVVRYYYNRIIAPDYNKDGFPDISLGVAGGFFYDWWWWFSYPAEFHAGWDKVNGNYISIFYDFYGHGTACASAAAGRGIVDFNGRRLTGIAPEAGIVGVKALWIGNTEVGMLWAAGFDVNPYNGSFYYTGSRRAHIISNSWGISYFTYDVGASGLDFESIFVAGLSLPGFLDQQYPGILIVQAGGNGGPGYGTITMPGASPFILTVGASTSTHVWNDTPGWYTYDDVVSWSLRGPTAFGYVKPDVVSVGAFGYTAAPVGINFWVFGGTSYATPLTAGVAALVYQALGGIGDPSTVKRVITTTADPLVQGPLSEGSGRINAYKAVSLARLLSGAKSGQYWVIAGSTSLPKYYNNKARSLWYWQWSDNIRCILLRWAGSDLPLRSFDLPTVATRLDSPIFFGEIQAGSSGTASFSLANPTNKTLTFTVTAQKFVVTKSQTFNRSLSLEPNTYENSTYILIAPENVTNTASLEVAAVIPYSSLDGNNDYYPDAHVSLELFIWKVDANNNNYPDSNEIYPVNYASEDSNYAYATIRFPVSRISGTKGLVIKVDLRRGWGISSGERVPPVPITITLNYIHVTGDSWVAVSPTSTTIQPGSSATFQLQASVPTSAMPTVYTGRLYVSFNATGGFFEIPYSFTVYKTANSDFTELVSGTYDRWPDFTTIRGANSWAWRYESGDWRFFYMKPSTSGLAWEFEGRWTNPDTMLIGYTLGPDGQFAGAYYGMGASYHYYLGGGIFEWIDTGAGSIQNARRVVIFPSLNYRDWLYPHSKPETNIFTFVLRTGLYDGNGGFSEPYGAKVRVLTAQSLLPASTSGDTFVIKFSLPYIVRSIYTGAWLPPTPYLSYDQHYTPGSVSISPQVVYGPYPAGTIFTFSYSAYNYGNSGQTFDAIASWRAYMPSLPIYSRYYNNYYKLTDLYQLEDWIRVYKP